MSQAKHDKVSRYQTALFVNIVVALLQALTLFFLADSISLFGDTAHSVSDVVVLAGTIFVVRQEIAEPGAKHTGLKRLLVRAAGVLLLLSAIYVAWEGGTRIIDPVPFAGIPVVIVSLIAVIGNFSAHRLIDGIDREEQDAVHHANIAHILTDLVLSVVVLVSALGTLFFGLPVIDAWCSLVIALWMFIWGWRIVRGSFSSDPDHDHHGHSHRH